ncbi:MAG: hypothetical protein HS132_19235 [Planctomycetia bacterium]|nr:hypothetical protein [Planctomycetia bacterium]
MDEKSFACNCVQTESEAVVVYLKVFLNGEAGLSYFCVLKPQLVFAGGG